MTMRHIFTSATIVAVCLMATACKKEQTPPAKPSTVEPYTPSTPETPAKPGAQTKPAAAPAQGGYTCPMHPEVKSDQPAKCPKCGMDLVPAKPTASATPSTTTKPAVVANASSEPPAPAAAAGDKLDSIESIPVSLKPAAGRALALVFWNTRDPGMDAQAKAAIVLYRRFHAKGLDMVGICGDASVDRVTDFAERWQFPWPQVMDAWGGDNKPFERFKIEKTPVCLLINTAGESVPLKLDTVEETHATVAKTLNVKPADVPMPDAPSRFVDPGRRQTDVMSELRMAVMTEAGDEAISEALEKVLEEDDSRARVDEVVDLLCESMRKNYGPVVQQSMDKISAEARIRMVRAVMVKAADGLECLLPAVKKMGGAEESLDKVTRWDRSQLGRALVLAGEFEKGAAVLRKVAEEAEGESAWWYMVGWAELCAGRAGPGKEALAKSYRSDGEYSGSAAKMGGHMAGYMLGKTDEQAYLKAQDTRVAQFFIAERLMLAGEKDKAIEAYNACIKAARKSSDPWPANWAKLRLKQLDGKEPGLPKPLPADAQPWASK
jgi:hypothetical protein